MARNHKIFSGYDANDDFIDDSEAHDVFVPQEYDTWHGGFYVNQGKLRFKMGDESEEVNLITGTKKRNLGLKRLDEEDEHGDDDEDDEKENNDTQKVKPKIQKPAQSAAQERVHINPYYSQMPFRNFLLSRYHLPISTTLARETFLSGI